MRKILRSRQKNHMQVLVSRGQISKQMRGSLIGQRERTQKCINRRLLQPPTEQREIPQRKRDIPRTLRNPRSATLEHHHHHSQSSPAIIQLCTSNSSVTLHPTLSSSTHQALYCVTSTYEKDIDVTSSCAHSFAHYSIILTPALLVGISIVLVYVLLSILTTIVSP